MRDAAQMRMTVDDDVHITSVLLITNLTFNVSKPSCYLSTMDAGLYIISLCEAVLMIKMTDAVRINLYVNEYLPLKIG